MNDLIHFRPAKVRRRSTSGDGGAQILFFTGVRYHRIGDDKRAQAPQTERSAERNDEGAGAGGRDRTHRR
jgi:hypothetical protein